jgi:hypothetical protein
MIIVHMIIALIVYDLFKLIIRYWLLPLMSRIGVNKLKDKTEFVFYNKKKTIGEVFLTIKI